MGRYQCVGDAAECLNDGKKIGGFTGGDTKPTFGNGCGGTGQIRCGGNLPTYGNGLIGPPVDPCSNGQTCLLPWTPPQNYSNPPTVQPSILIQIESLTIGFIVDMATASPLMYRKVFTAAKAFNPNPFLDGVLGAAGQGLDDLVNPNLSIEQRGGKILIAGTESIASGFISDLVGVGVVVLVPHPLVTEGDRLFPQLP